MNFSQKDTNEALKCCNVSNAAAAVPPPKQSISHDYITDALEQLSIQARERVYHDICGVSDVVEETPALVHRALNDIQMWLSKLKNTQSPAESAGLLLAEQQSKEYVYHPTTLLRFLRADRFDAKAAAIRIFNYFNLKIECFGSENLAQDITYEDLHPQDRLSLLKGGFQNIPERDRSGRAIVFVSATSFEHYNSIESYGRVGMYNFPHDEETLKNGLVAIVHDAQDNDPSNNPQSKLGDHAIFKCMLMSRKLRQAIPARVSAVHFCCKVRSCQSFLLDIFLKVMDKDSRSRTRVHHGPHVQCLYNLMTYGIPVKAIPIDDQGRLKVKNHVEWLQMRRKREEMQKSGVVADNFIDVPSHTDFLIGRGKPIQVHKGNIRLHSIIDAFLPRFDSATKAGKTQLAEEIVCLFKAEKGRFLSQEESGVWMGVSDEVARGKVAQLFRSRRKLKPNNSQSLRQSGTSDFSELASQKSSCPQPETTAGRQGSFFIQNPSPNDFLVGQGKPIQCHPGNVRLHYMIDENLPKFDVATKKGKTQISAEIVSRFKSESGRFLAQENGLWMEVNDEIARVKVAQHFRYRRKLEQNPPSSLSKGSNSDTDKDSGTVDSTRKRVRLD